MLFQNLLGRSGSWPAASGRCEGVVVGSVVFNGAGGSVRRTQAGQSPKAAQTAAAKAGAASAYSGRSPQRGRVGVDPHIALSILSVVLWSVRARPSALARILRSFAAAPATRSLVT